MHTDSDSWLPPSIDKDGMSQPSVTVGELENLRKQAYSEGFRQGKEEGHQIGLENARAEAENEHNARLAALAQMIEQMKSPLQREMDDVSNIMSDIVQKICVELGSQYAQLESSVSKEIVSQLLGELPLNTQTLTVRMSATEASLIQEYIQQYHADLDVNIVADQRISCGGVVVENNEIFLDASIEQRIADIVGKNLSSQSSSLKQGH